MKKLIFAVLLVVSTSASAACSTHTYIVGGQMVTCTTCGTVTTCFQERAMIDIQPDYDKMMELYAKIDAVKEDMGERYRLHPSNFVKHKDKDDDMARDCNLFSDNSERSASLLIHIDDLEWW